MIAKETLGPGSSWDLDFSPDAEQEFLYVADGTNQQVWILGRKDLDICGTFGRSGRNAGQFHWLHNLAGGLERQHLHQRSPDRKTGAEVRLPGRRVE